MREESPLGEGRSQEEMEMEELLKPLFGKGTASNYRRERGDRNGEDCKDNRWMRGRMRKARIYLL